MKLRKCFSFRDIYEWLAMSTFAAIYEKKKLYAGIFESPHGFPFDSQKNEIFLQIHSSID